MSKRFFALLFTSAFGLTGIAGCRHCCQHGDYVASAPPPCCDPAPAGQLRPFHALTPRRYDALPGPMPPPRTDILGPPVATPPGAPAPAVPPPDFRGYGPPSVPPPPEPTWRPSPDASRSPAGTEPSKDPVRLYPPESTEPPPAPAKPDVTPPERPPAPPLPVGIPQFMMMRNRVAAGLKPSLEGLDWLQTNNYRTVLHIRRPGEDDVADRRQVEKRGMKYVSLEVSPQTLNREVVDQFNHLVGEVTCLPLFVYDKDGALQGGLWYLHFRIVDLVTDEVARIRVRPLGLTEDSPNAEQREMWLAVQKFLGAQNRDRE